MSRGRVRELCGNCGSVALEKEYVLCPFWHLGSAYVGHHPAQLISTSITFIEAQIALRYPPCWGGRSPITRTAWPSTMYGSSGLLSVACSRIIAFREALHAPQAALTLFLTLLLFLGTNIIFGIEFLSGPLTNLWRSGIAYLNAFQALLKMAIVA